MAKTVFLQIRLTKEEKRRLERAAKATYLETSTWARMVLLKAANHVREEEREGD